MTALDVVHRYFDAMRAGEAELDTLLALFAEDAVYIEPFSGQSRTHEGRAAIESCLRGSMQQAPPDLELDLGRVDVDGDRVRSEWECRSPVFERPIEGVDECTVRAGKIVRLEVRFR